MVKTFTVIKGKLHGKFSNYYPISHAMGAKKSDTVPQ